MLLDGASARIASAIGHMTRGNHSAKGGDIGDTLAIIGCLKGALNMEQGGEIAARLEQLYDYMDTRLVEASAANDVAAAQEVLRLLTEIREAWMGLPEQLNQQSAAIRQVGSP